MAVFISLPPELRNGPEEVGLAAGVDLLTDPAKALLLGETNEALTAYLYADSQLTSVEQAKKGGLYAAAYRLGAFAIAQYRWHADALDANTIKFDPSDAKHAGFAKHDGNAAATPPIDPTIDRVKADLALVSMDKVMLLIVATKLTWWQTNHHVGQGAYAGFAAKTARFTFGQGEEHEDFKELHWQLGHMASTKAILYALGLRTISKDGFTPIQDFPTATRDINLRLQSNPAGTAKLFDTHQGLLMAARTAYCMVFEPIADLGLIANGVKAVMASPVAHHVGARFLTGQPQLAVYMPLDESSLAAAAFVHSFTPNGTLSKAKALPPVSQVTSHPVYLTVLKIKSLIAQGKGEDMDLKGFTPKLGRNVLQAIDPVVWQPGDSSLQLGAAEGAPAPATSVAVAAVGTAAPPAAGAPAPAGAAAGAAPPVPPASGGEAGGPKGAKGKGKGPAGGS